MTWPDTYRKLESFDCTLGPVTVWLSTDISDPLWDGFLMKTPLGQFQQSSMWAQYKTCEGWSCHRYVATVENQIVGGCQILWKKTRFGRIGYVSKGPVAVPEIPDLAEPISRLLCAETKKLGLLALIAQPPDDSQITSDILERLKFIQSNPMNVVECTLLVDVSKGRLELEKQLSRSTRKNIRIAQECGVIIKEGKPEDHATFFNLMLETCKRQKTEPNPSSAELLSRLWSVFQRGNCLKVVFAEIEGKVVAGVLNIPFGKKVNVWKKGWSTSGNGFHPNDLLYHDILQWAAGASFSDCDFAAFDKGIAESLSNNVPLTKCQQQTRHVFNLRFGGIPKTLPPARLWAANPFLHFGYRAIMLRLGLLGVVKKALHH